ncbi:NAD(P)H-dependent FMN reductase [Micromonospora pattaloongensis]|uniref:NAD(P)H-dependent FMN reductase n=1 Tax=Micromonospora pattaloongensis TaxID=405436 RepID=A0A1H3R278_9ACTN|nr:NAD(P)H-dependent oxidoreductase [Micromonospora pattaloongensis]SDZ19696.1 NAD(P)H-dependent FMN reductase [Micromonospora pattaloongensis]
MTESPYRLAVILASVRSGRFGPVVAKWCTRQAEQRGDVVVDLIDLAETPLPVAGQATPVVTGQYEAEDVRAFAERIGRADAFVVVTPEYNHGYPGALKIAIDAVNPEWHAKPVGFVSYGGISGGLRAVEQLRVVFAELHPVTVRETVSFAMCHGKFGERGEPLESGPVNQAARALLDQIAWWARVLRDARAARPYRA